MNSGYSKTESYKIIRTIYNIKTYRHLSAKLFKDWLSKIPDDAVLLGFEDNENFEADLELHFQKEAEIERLAKDG